MLTSPGFFKKEANLYSDDVDCNLLYWLTEYQKAAKCRYLFNEKYQNITKFG